MKNYLTISLLFLTAISHASNTGRDSENPPVITQTWDQAREALKIHRNACPTKNKFLCPDCYDNAKNEHEAEIRHCENQKAGIWFIFLPMSYEYNAEMETRAAVLRNELEKLATNKKNIKITVSNQK